MSISLQVKGDIMPLIKNEFPILEYDSSNQSVIMPNHDSYDIILPKKIVFAFLGSTVDKLVKRYWWKTKKLAEFESCSGNIPVYEMVWNNEKIGLCRVNVGAAASVQLLEWLIAYGAQQIIGIGSCGALIKDNEGELFIPTSAIRDEGTSYHYLPPAREISANIDFLTAIEKSLLHNKIKYKKCKTWTTDGFFRETAEMVDYRKKEGCSVVEMECAGLMACAEFRKVDFGMILFTADSLLDLNNYNKRNWGGKNRGMSLLLCCLDVITHISK